MIRSDDLTGANGELIRAFLEGRNAWFNPSGAKKVKDGEAYWVKGKEVSEEEYRNYVREDKP